MLEDRDNFIARTIESTLKEGDTGVLFIGAYHEILSKLTADIQVVQVKDIEKIRKYHRELLSPKRDVKSFQELSDYLMSPVKLKFS